jgi:hypothetical protein
MTEAAIAAAFLLSKPKMPVLMHGMATLPTPSLAAVFRMDS